MITPDEIETPAPREAPINRSGDEHAERPLDPEPPRSGPGEPAPTAEPPEVAPHVDDPEEERARS